MRRRPLRLVVVTAAFPFGPRESFLGPELRALAGDADITIIPVWPGGGRLSAGRLDFERRTVRRHPYAPPVLGAALAELLQHPVTTTRALRSVVGTSLLRSMKDLAAVPKGLWLARRLRRWQVDHVHASWVSIPATVAMIAAEATGAPWSMSAHRGDIEVDQLLARKVRSATFVRAVSRSSAERLRGKPGCAGRAFPVIHLGVEVPDGAPGPAPDAVTVLSVARLIPLKRHEDLLDATRILSADERQVRLDLAGDGPMFDELRELARRLGIEDRVRFLGHVDNAALLELYRSGSVALVALASDVEGIPMSLVEAMAANIPVVATDVGGVAELIREGSGMLVPPRDPAGLAAAIGELLGSSDLRSAVGAAGRAVVEREFDAKVTATQLLDLMTGGPSG